MGHVFISYSHRDSKYAHALAAHLHEMGFGVWIDERLDYGSRWPHEIQKQLDTCDAFILVMSPRSFASDWVQSELQRAKRKLKPMFPLLLDGDEPWLSVENLQYYDVRGERFPDEKFYTSLKREIKADPRASTLNFEKIKQIPDRPARPQAWKFLAGGVFLSICITAPILFLGWRYVTGQIPGITFSPTATQWIRQNVQATETLIITPTVDHSVVDTVVVPSDTSVPSDTPLPPTLTATLIPPSLTFTPIPPTATSAPNLALYGLWNSELSDNALTTLWSTTGSSQFRDYQFARLEGYVFSPDQPQPPGTIPLYRWFSAGHGDHFTTTLWTGQPGDRRSPGYVLDRIEGYVYDPDAPQPPGTVALYGWWSDSRKDNFTTTTPAWGVDLNEIKSPDYGFVRREGYVRQP